MDQSYISEFMNGGCFALAKRLNELYEYEIFYVIQYDKNNDYIDEDDYINENGIIHALVRIGDDQFLDITGINSAYSVIKFWYEELCTIISYTEIFLVSEQLINIITRSKKNETVISDCTQNDILKYDLINHCKTINWNYNGDVDLNKICQLLTSHYGIWNKN